MDEYQQQQPRNANSSTEWVATNGISNNDIIVLSTFAQAPLLPEVSSEINTATAVSPPTNSSTGMARMTEIRTQIKRGKTGCFTCRKRRKKCDETKPSCVGCLRSGYICEGYPVALKYEASKAKRSSTSRRTPLQKQQQQQQTAVSALQHVASPVNSARPVTAVEGSSSSSGDEAINWFYPVSSFDNYNDMGSGVGVDDTMLPFAAEGPSLLSYLDAEQEAYPLPLETPAHVVPQRDIPRGLPLLITGVESVIEQKCFFHFTSVTSKVLTTSTDDKNPLLTVILPRSLDDAMISKAISCLGSSHLSNLRHQRRTEEANSIDSKSNNFEPQAEQRRILALAENELEKRLSAFKASGGRQNSSKEFEALLTATLLLCLYEISEGSGNHAWRTRLDKARDLIKDALPGAASYLDGANTWPAQAPRSPTLSLSLSLGVDQFLLDYFVYHDVLAGVTDRTRKPLFKSSARSPLEPHQSPAYVIGVEDDGLAELIANITALRTMAASHGRKSPVVVCEAISIWEKLDAWTPAPNLNSDDTLDRDLQLACAAYTSALFVWLYSIIYPENMLDQKVTAAIRRGISGVHAIQSQGMLAFLLFPAFTLGAACVLPEQREDATRLFERLRRFSNLGNVRLAQTVVEQAWSDYDTGTNRETWWDWLGQMEARGVSLPVT